MLSENEFVGERNRRPVLRNRLWVIEVSLILLAFLAGWWVHPSQKVYAQGTAPLIQFESLNPNSALSIYYPDRQEIYIYQPAAVGSPKLNCAFYFQLGGAGAPVKRNPCKAPSFQP